MTRNELINKLTEVFGDGIKSNVSHCIRNTDKLLEEINKLETERKVAICSDYTTEVDVYESEETDEYLFELRVFDYTDNMVAVYLGVCSRDTFTESDYIDDVATHTDWKIIK